MSKESQNNQNNLVINIVKLCEDIIFKKDFKLVFDLDKCCMELEQKMAKTSLADNEESCLILIYFIYYLLLKPDERYIFMNISKLILHKNTFLVNIYENEDRLAADREALRPEDAKLQNYTAMIMQRYKDNRNSLEDINKDTIKSINNFIRFLYENNYCFIPNDYYLSYFLAIGTLNYTSVLSQFSYDIIMARSIEVVHAVLSHIDKETGEFVEEETEEESYIERLVNELML